ncbi:hypothetical protein LEP1GSC188_4708 [Leptospira weilii serovar Topaz str. LT2116]|uniref:Uncharacterized protein n=1 Tax=Leptospira weilii serovar Topaz str. LT2116 TaxID=1088540 RepID=M3EMI8_9LEPT|nr:hypothetical protein LEP1GSC188_4708 [Leptospira weilii serovar Topaz str. LT2116]
MISDELILRCATLEKSIVYSDRNFFQSQSNNSIPNGV